MQRGGQDRVSDLAALASAYGRSLARNHPYNDGHKRVAFLAMYTFLALNGVELDAAQPEALMQAGLVSVEMESDTLFVVGAYRGWRTGALYASDGAPGEIKPPWGEADYRRGEQQAITVALQAMHSIAQADARPG